MRVSEREESALSADGKKERGTRAQMFRVHVAPEPGRGEDRMLARLRGGDADRPRERPVWQGDPVGKAHGGGLRIDFRDTEPRVWIFVGEEPEIRNDRSPAPLRRPEFEQLHRKDVARPGTLDENRSADGVDVREVELRHILDTRVAVDLLVGGVADVELDRLPGLHLQRGHERVVPDVVEGVRADFVDGDRVHSTCGREPAFVDARLCALGVHLTRRVRDQSISFRVIAWIAMRQTSSPKTASAPSRAKSFHPSEPNTAWRTSTTQ